MRSPEKFSRRDLVGLLLGGLALPARLVRAELSSSPELQQVCDRMVAMDNWRTEMLLGYSVRRHYSLCRGHNPSCAEMDVRVEYSYPGRKTFQVVAQKGSGTIQNHVFSRLMDAEEEAARDDVRDRTRISPRNYDFQLLGTETLEGRPSYVIRMKPKQKRRFLVDGRIWVDSEDSAVARIEGEPAETSFWVRHSHMVQCYKKIGRFWLVASNHTDTDVRFFGKAQLNIEYQDYRVRAADMTDRAANVRSAARP